MILVRMVFQAKFGKAGEVVEAFKQHAVLMQEVVGSKICVRILTDLSGQFDTVVQELEVESLAEWERLREVLFTAPEFQEQQASMEEAPFLTGRTEFYTLEATF